MGRRPRTNGPHGRADEGTASNQKKGIERTQRAVPLLFGYLYDGGGGPTVPGIRVGAADQAPGGLSRSKAPFFFEDLWPIRFSRIAGAGQTVGTVPA